MNKAPTEIMTTGVNVCSNLIVQAAFILEKPLPGWLAASEGFLFLARQIGWLYVFTLIMPFLILRFNL